MPAEEARKDRDTEDILFRVYEYKVLLQSDGKEQQQLEMIQKRAKIGKFHCLYYLPALGHGRYIQQATSLLLDAGGNGVR